jgi:hypothetical protein
MRDISSLIWLALIGLFRSRASLQAEIVTLRHHLNALRRKSPQRIGFTSIQHRPSGICRVVLAGTWRSGRFEDRQAGDHDSLASGRRPSVLALEIKTAVAVQRPRWKSVDSFAR